MEAIVFIILQIFSQYEFDKYINNILHLARKYSQIGYLSADIICSEKRTVSFEEHWL